jgi:hypothetical protein
MQAFLTVYQIKLLPAKACAPLGEIVVTAQSIQRERRSQPLVVAVPGRVAEGPAARSSAC